VFIYRRLIEIHLCDDTAAWQTAFVSFAVNFSYCKYFERGCKMCDE